jgi:hypothetical protein
VYGIKYLLKILATNSIDLTNNKNYMLKMLQKIYNFLLNFSLEDLKKKFFFSKNEETNIFITNEVILIIKKINNFDINTRNLIKILLFIIRIFRY